MSCINEGNIIGSKRTLGGNENRYQICCLYFKLYIRSIGFIPTQNAENACKQKSAIFSKKISKLCNRQAICKIRSKFQAVILSDHQRIVASSVSGVLVSDFPNKEVTKRNGLSNLHNRSLYPFFCDLSN